MATKRSYSDIHPSRREQVPQASRKRQKPDNLGSKSFKKAHPVNDLKTRARNVARLLARTDDKLPAHIRVAKERELQTVQHELKEAQAAERKSKLIARYHHIRFFERQKATRALKKARKQLSASSDDQDDQVRQKLKKEIDEYELDVNYTIYYPLDRPYHSLFPKDKDDADGATNGLTISKGDTEIRKLVQQCMQDGRLQALRDGLLTSQEAELPATDDSGPLNTKGVARKEKAPTKQSRKIVAPVKPQDNGDDDDSDGGFFE